MVVLLPVEISKIKILSHPFQVIPVLADSVLELACGLSRALQHKPELLRGQHEKDRYFFHGT